MIPHYLTKRSFKEEQIEGSQDSVCSCSLLVPGNQLGTLLDLDLFGDTDGFAVELEALVSGPFCAVNTFSIALPNNCKKEKKMINSFMVNRNDSFVFFKIVY